MSKAKSQSRPDMTTVPVTTVGVRYMGSRLRTVAFVLLVALACIAVGSTRASAFETRPLVASVQMPESVTHSVDVDQNLERIYVVQNPDGNDQGHVYAFNPNGTRVTSLPPLTSTSASLTPTAVGVDNSGGAHQSFVYVAEAEIVQFVGEEPRIQQYTPTGVATSVVITAAAVPPTGTPQGGGLPPVVRPSRFSSYAIAVGPEGNLFMTTGRGGEPGAIDVFAPDGTFIVQLAAGENYEAVTGIAVDASGNIYISDRRDGLIERDSEGACVDACNPIDPTNATAVAVNRTKGTILVAQESGNPGGSGRIREYDSTHALIAQFGAEDLQSPQGLGTLESQDSAYVAGPEREGKVKIYGAPIVLPDVTTEPATGVTDSAATFHGQVGAAGVAGATCAFQYVTQEDFEATGFAEAAVAPCNPGGPFSGSALAAVEAQVQGLSGGTTYHYRLAGTNTSGTNPGEDIPFTTSGPHVGAEFVGTVSETTAELGGLVNPRGELTTYQFEYVTRAAFEASGFAGSVMLPAVAEEIGLGTADVSVGQQATGLTPGVPYVFRLSASNATGISHGVAKGFQPYPVAAALPDGRAYEQVTPVSKNGNNVLGFNFLLKAAPEGGAVTYFITSGDESSEGGQEFPVGIGTRGATNWSPSSLLPPSTYGERINVVAWGKDPRISYPLLWNSGTKATIYQRNSVTGAMTAIATGLEPEFGALVADESDGASQVLFESTNKLLPEAIEGGRGGPQNLYIWDRASGALQLVSVLPNGSTAPEGGMAGTYQWLSDHRDEGGARGATYTQEMNVLSDDGSRVFFTTPGDDQIYARKDPTSASATTVQVSASQKTNGPAGGAQPAAFMGATPNGHYAFFTSFGELTNDATTGAGGNDLYRFDTDTNELIDIAPDPAAQSGNGAEVQGVIGASDDGSYVYFVANGVLATGARQGGCRSGPRATGGVDSARCNVYVWHEGEISFVASVNGNFAGDGLNWIPTGYEGDIKPPKPSRVSPDGRTLLFFSQENLTGYDSEGKNEAYRYRFAPGGQGVLNCVSCNPSGQAPLGKVSLHAIGSVLQTKPRAPQVPQQAHNLSASGDQVFFETPDSLVAADTNGVMDVYEWEADGAGSCRSQSQNGGCIFLISPPNSATPSYFNDASESGDDVYFFTRASLVPQDTDELQDVYDARVGGGLPAQYPQPAVPCAGEACRGPGQDGTPAAPAGTSSFVGPGNPRASKPVTCRKGKVRRKGKCVKKRPAHHKKGKHKKKSGHRKSGKHDVKKGKH